MPDRLLGPNVPFFHEERAGSLGPARDARIIVCGAGALGGNLAETLARMGFAQLVVIDRDRVELRNLSTQPYSMAEVGGAKARALANILYRAVGTHVQPLVLEVHAGNAAKLLAGSALVVDAFDNQAARAAVSATARSCDLPCLHIGFSGDGQYGSGVWEPAYRVPALSSGDPCDYPLTRPFALIMAALAARAVRAWLCEGRTICFELTWGDVRIQEQSSNQT
jgi:hypothetical protein